MRWTVKLVVTAATAKHTPSAVSLLNSSGFQYDDIEIIAARGTSLGVDDNQVAKKKLKKQDLAACNAAGLQAMLFAAAMTSHSESFISNTDVVLVMTPDIVIWRFFREFMEATIEPNYFSVYFPYTPSRFFLVHDRPIPKQQHGWYRFVCDEPVGGSSCLCMNSHTAMLLGSMVRQDQASDEAKWANTSWDFLLSVILARSRVDCYGAGVPFAYLLGAPEDVERAVPMNLGLKKGFELRNWYYM